MVLKKKFIERKKQKQHVLNEITITVLAAVQTVKQRFFRLKSNQSLTVIR